MRAESYIGLLVGEKVPIITDRNPHQEVRQQNEEKKYHRNDIFSLFLDEGLHDFIPKMNECKKRKIQKKNTG